MIFVCVFSKLSLGSYCLVLIEAKLMEKKVRESKTSREKKQVIPFFFVYANLARQQFKFLGETIISPEFC